MKIISDSTHWARGSEDPRAFIDPGSADVRRAETERLASLGTLTAGVAHEINNPLTYVLGSLDLGLRELQELRTLLDGRAQESAHVSGAAAALESAREGAERVRNIVRDLMSFSRAAPGVGDAVDIEVVLDATVRIAWNEIRHRARLIKQYAGIARVSGDEARLGQVFLNLIMNAAHAIEGGPELNEIVISTSTSQEGMAVIEVSDTGGGIVEQDLPRVFEPFFTTKPAGVGVGLGLAICHGIVAGLGGEISVASHPRRGSVFRVVLPFAPSDSAVRRAVVDAPSESETGPARILIIDDEPLLGQTLLYAFKGRHDVVICTSGRDGLSRLEKDARFDLVLCDLMMPDVSGAAVFESVKRNHPELVARFVFMTGGAFTERAREFLSQYSGAQLEKPFNIAEIEKILRQVKAQVQAAASAPVSADV